MKPNVLFIMTDQMRHDAIGSVGGWTRTPNLDALASKGVLFEQCITTSPVCIPARISLQSGLYPHNTGVWENTHVSMPPEWSNWMPALRAAGYRTSVFGKTHLHPHSGDLRDREDLVHEYGLDDIDEIGGPRASARVGSNMTDRWAELGLLDAYREDYRRRFAVKPWVARPSVLPREEYADSYVGRSAREYLSSYDREEPWFCWVSFGGPHEPWDAPEPFASMYDPKEMPRPLDRGDTRTSEPRGALYERYERRPEIPEEEILALRANYAGNVTLIDEEIGRIMEVVRRRGEEENTIVVFTSDHGEMNGDHGLLYKENFLDPAVRVPLIVCPAGGSESRRTRALVELLDVGPTILDLAGVPVAEDRPGFGRSLADLVSGGTDRHREYVVSELSGEVMVMTGNWKLVLNRDGAPYLLFDRYRDPNETRNLVGNPDAQRAIGELTALAARHQISTMVRRSDS